MRYRFASWLQKNDDLLIAFVNCKLKCGTLDWLMPRITHLGGARFTVAFCLLWWIILPGDYGNWGMQAFIALTVSHLIVRFVKKYTWARKRPYKQLHHLYTFPNPLEDHSFPSGHTTAICSLAAVFVLHEPLTALVMFPLALFVGISRMYLGLHYATDVVTGALLGTVCAVFVVIV